MTPEVLAVCTGARIDRARTYAVPLTDAMQEYHIDTPVRQAAFLPNVGHESGGLHWAEEVWGPTASQLRYEGRLDLGNTQPGDGQRFKGHGLLETTGRKNHAAARDRLRARFPDLGVPDFEAYPEALALPQWAALSAADYWDMRKLNDWADRGDFDGVCDLINLGRKTITIGDANGYAERFKLWGFAKTALGVA